MDKKTQEKLHRRMTILIKPIDQQIMMTDDINELLLLATAMMQRVVVIYDNQYGREGRNALLKDIMEK
jgi:hypothetical protein